MEDNINGRRHQWEKNPMEGSLNGQSQWKTASMEDSLNGRQPQWKTTSMETKCQWRITSMEEDLKEALQEDDTSLFS